MLFNQNEKLKCYFMKSAKIDFEIFNFSDNLKYFSKVNLAITRSGAINDI